MMAANAKPRMTDRRQERINLSLGEPCYEPPEEARNAAAYALLQGGNGYLSPGGLPELRVALAQKLRDQNGIAATTNQVNVTVGASLGLFSTIAVLCRPGDGVLIPDPCFPLYRLMLKTQRLAPLPYLLKPKDGYAPDWNSLEDQAKAARVLLWNFPSNPLGVIARAAWLSRLYGLLDKYPHLHLISDEVYEDLLFRGDHCSPAARAGELAQRIISIFSFSKSYGMTGWRVGYVHAMDTLAGRIEKAHWGAAMSVPTIAQHAAVAALQAPPSYHQEVHRFLRHNRTVALDRLRKWKMPCSEPQAGFFLWVNISSSGLDSVTFAERCGEECGVLVSPGVFFSPNATHYVRLCFAVETKALAEGLDVIGSWVNALHRAKK